MEGDDRVEIELTPVDPGRSKPDRVPPREDESDAATTAGSAAPSRAASTAGYSLRAVITIACVGTGALGLGWTLGRSTGDDSADVAVTSETAADPPETLAPDSGPTLPPVESTVATTVRRTTTTLPPIESRTIDVDPALLGADFEIVGIDQSGNLIRLDLADGDLETRRDLGRRTGGPGMMWAGDAWVVLPDWSNGTTTLVEDGADPVRLDIGHPWQYLASETPGEFWIVDGQLPGGIAASAQRVDRYGDAIGEPVELAQRPVLADPTGGLVVVAAGRTYRVDHAGATKIADGTVLALDAAGIVARTCDDHLECEYVLVDRTTATSRPLPIDASIDYQVDLWPGSDMTRIAPDGHTIAVTWFDPATGAALDLIDLRTGEVTELTRAGDVMVHWSPDGRFAVYTESGVPMAHELVTGESFVISEGLPRLDGLAIRAAS